MTYSVFTISSHCRYGTARADESGHDCATGNNGTDQKYCSHMSL